MATECLRPIKGVAMRVTKLDSCGAPVLGAKSQVVSAGMISVEQKINTEDPTEYKLKNANDVLLVNERGKRVLNWIDLTITLGEVDPEMWNLMLGYPIVLDDAATPNAVGSRTRENVYADFGLEVWTNLGGQVCAAGFVKYGYTLFPWVTEGQSGDVTTENGTSSFTVTGRTQRSSPWGIGPYNVRRDVSNNPAKLLSPIDAADHRHLQMTTLAPPATACGAIALS